MALAKRKQHLEEEPSSQLAKFPQPDEIEELLSVLRVSTLREMSVEIVNGSIEHAKGNIDRLEYATLIRHQ